MTSKGHKLTAMAFGGLIAAMMLTGHLVPPYPQEYILAVTGLWFAGIVIGSSSPDWLEVVTHVKGGTGQKDRRLSLIPHRTLTHWPPLWIGIAYLLWQQEFTWFVESFAFGFIASALLHIAMDSLSKSGVPILLPLAKFRSSSRR